MKRFICMFMVLCMLVSLMPTIATAEENPEPAAEQEELYTVEIPEETGEDQTEALLSEETVSEETKTEPGLEEYPMEEAEDAAVEEITDEELSAPIAEENEFAAEPEQEATGEEQVPEEPTAGELLPEEPAQVPAVEEMIAEEFAEEPAEEPVVEEFFQDESAAEQAEQADLPEKTADMEVLPEEPDEEQINEEKALSEAEIRKNLDTEETISTVSAADATQTSSDWLLPTIDGKLITQDTYKDKIQLLVFYRGTGQCGNSNNLIYSLSRAWWTENPALQVIAVESDIRADTDQNAVKAKEATKSFVETYASDAKNIVFAYNGSDLMWSIVRETKLSSSSIMFGVCAILKKEW